MSAEYDHENGRYDGMFDGYISACTSTPGHTINVLIYPRSIDVRPRGTSLLPRSQRVASR